MKPSLRIRLINLGNNNDAPNQLREAFEEWGYAVFSGSGEESVKCDTIITMGLPYNPEPSARIVIDNIKDKEIIISGKDMSLSDFATAVVKVLTDQLLNSRSEVRK